MFTFVRANRQRDWRRLQEIDKKFYPLDWWEREDFFEPGLIIYMVFHRARFAGWVGFWLDMKFPVEKRQRWHRKGCLYIGGISVKPAFFREDVIKKIVAFVLGYADDHGMTEVSTNERESHPLLPLLKKCGFYEVATTNDHWEDPAEPNEVLRLDI